MASINVTPETNDPEKATWFIQATPIIFMAILAGAGGAVRYLVKIDRRGLPFRFVNFVIEIFISAFTGIVVFMLCDAAGWGWEYTAAIVAISGHMGARAWHIAEKIVIEPTLRRYGYDDSKTETGSTEEKDS